MEGSAVGGLGATDGCEGEGGVGEYGRECDGQRIRLGERGERCNSIRRSEPVEAWQSGDLSTDCCYQVLSIQSVVGLYTITNG